MDEQHRLGKWERLHGSDRDRFIAECIRLYEHDQMSLREISQRTGRSYGSIHEMLLAAGVRMRPRGNPRSGRTPR